MTDTPKTEATLPAGVTTADQLQKTPDGAAFDLIQRQAKAYASSTIVPKDYQNNVPNCIIAMEMANRMQLPVMVVMQQLYIVNGRPGWSSTFLIASINQSGRFSPLRYEERGNDPTADTYAVRAWANDKAGERLNGTWITWAMVKAEKWFDKPGSKWKTMPDQMFKYRAAAFWQRAYCPEISMGFLTQEEVDDIETKTEDITAVVVPDREFRFSPADLDREKDLVKNQVHSVDGILQQYPNLAPDQVEELRKAEPKEQ